MGTTSEKLTYLNVTKQKLKQAINNIGGEVTDETTFRNYVAELENAYDRLPKTEFEEGESVTLENTLKGKLDFDDGKVGFGQSSQDSTQGYNLFNPTEVFNNLNGVTSTITNQIMKWNGTASANGAGKVANVNIPSGTITISLTTVSGTHTSGKRIWVDVYNGNTKVGSTSLTQDGSTQVSISANANKVDLGFDNGDVFNNYTFKLQIETGSTAHDWEQYTGGYSSPSPNWVQEIKRVAGKNKFNIGTSLNDYFQTNTNGTKPGSWTVNAVTATIVGNKLTIDTYNSSGWNWLSKWVELEPNTDYTISGTNTSVLKIIGLNSNELQTQGTQVVQKTSSESVKTFNSGDYKYYCLSCFPEATGKYFENIQIEEGTQATPYLPYNTIEETIRGLNFFEAKMATDTSAGVTVTNNNDGTYTLNGTATGNTTFRIDQLSRNSQDNLKTYENGTYTLSIGNSKSGLGMAMMQIDTYRTFMYVGSGSSLVSRTLTNATSMFIYLDITSGTQFSNFVVKPMLVKGTYTEETLPSFEPYKTPKTYQFSLGDHKFYGIGNYKDELVYDVDEDKVYKKEKIHRYDFTGQEDWTRIVVTGKPLPYFRLYLTSQPLGIASTSSTILSNRYKGGTDAELVNNDYPTISMSGNANNQLNITQNLATADEFKAYLTNNPTYVCYPRVTDELIEITDTTLKAQVKAWYYAHSNNGTTIITSSGDLPMIIKVRGLKGE